MSDQGAPIRRLPCNDAEGRDLATVAIDVISRLWTYRLQRGEARVADLWYEVLRSIAEAQPFADFPTAMASCLALVEAAAIFDEPELRSTAGLIEQRAWARKFGCSPKKSMIPEEGPRRPGPSLEGDDEEHHEQFTRQAARPYG